MNHTASEVRKAALALSPEQVEEYRNSIDQSLWLEYALDLPSICTDRGQALADLADHIISEEL